MNQAKPDRRVQRTRKVLQTVLLELILEKDFAQITVAEVIERANVGRSTFYAHFKDKEDLFLSGFANLWSLFERHLATQTVAEPTVWDLNLVVFQHAQSYTGVYQALVGKHGGQLMAAHLHKYLAVLIRQSLQGSWAKTKTVPLEVAVYHLTSSLLALLAWWVDNGLPYPPARMNEMFQQLTQPAIAKIVA